jgi:hypothetical protein
MWTKNQNPVPLELLVCTLPLIAGVFQGHARRALGALVAPRCGDTITLDFETDDEGNPMAHGTKVDTEFDGGSVFPVTITGRLNISGLNTAAILNSTTGPASQDPDLLVQCGNILILQTDANLTECPPASGIYCSHNDDEDGGTLSFAFNGRTSPQSIVLIDIDATDPVSTVVLMDGNGLTRTYTIPANWTGDLVADGPPGKGTLSLTTLANQPGFDSTATAVQDGGFNSDDVVQIEVNLGGSGAVDNIVFIARVDIDVDTDRNAVIDGRDERAEDAWTRARGAFYLVNVDDDDGDASSDSVEYDADEDVVLVDAVINAGDAPDITPLVIRRTGNLNGRLIFLRAGSLDQIRAVHVFRRIAEGEASIWGGPNEVNDEIDVTAMVSPTADTMFGLEGLKYRLVANGVAGFTPDMLFDGFIQLTLVCKDAASLVTLSRDEVLLKVAPWMALPNTQDAEVVFAQEFSSGVPAYMGGTPVLLPTPNDKFREDISDNLVASAFETFTTDTQWAQDDLEIGYAQTPLSAQRVAAYTRHHGSSEASVLGIGDAQWRRDLLIGPFPVVDDVGIYRNPRSGNNSGDYGGNIELLPPTANHELGRICIGNTISAKKQQFFESQEVQPPFVVETDWLAVGHVDETCSFWQDAPLTVIVASPRLAYDILGYGGGFPAPPRLPSGFDPVPDDAVFFSEGEFASGVATGGGPGTLVDDNADFLNPPVPWEFVKIYDGNGAGQIAHIASIPSAHMLVVDTVWHVFPMTNPIQYSDPESPSAAPLNAIGYQTPVARAWFDGVIPDTSSKYVLVEHTLWWNAPPNSGAGPVFPLNKTPATITRRELNPTVAGSRGERMKTLNIDAQARINAIRGEIINAAAPDPVTFIEVPVIYTGTLNALDEIDMRTGVAWTPGAANILVADGMLFVAAQKGPRFRTPAGVISRPFDQVIAANLGASVVFVEDFDHYHALSGEVHCGTNVLRAIYPFSWWNHQPASVPSLP